MTDPNKLPPPKEGYHDHIECKACGWSSDRKHRADLTRPDAQWRQHECEKGAKIIFSMRPDDAETAKFKEHRAKQGKARTREEMKQFRLNLARLVEQHAPLTIRHLFYLAVSAGLCDKNEAQYGSIIKVVNEMRDTWLDGFKAGDTGEDEFCFEVGRAAIPFGDNFIVDGSREFLEAASFSSASEALLDLAESYRRKLWRESSKQLIFIAGKATISEMLFQTVAPADVPLAVMNGFSSHSALWNIAQRIDAEPKKETWVYYIDDHDAAGDHAFQDAKRCIERYVLRNKRPLHQEKLAITPEQIERFKLPLRPPKKTSEKKLYKFNKGCVEIDAMDPRELQRIVQAVIERHRDKKQWSSLMRQQEQEQEKLRALAKRFN
jgi:hypothetical protein